jgi:hypothetical protein
LLSVSGCTRTADYVEVAQSQQQAMREVTGILKKIHNARDMAAAREELDERFAQFDAVARKARELPKPPPPEVERQLDMDAFKTALTEMREQIDRVKQLEGGEEFFRQFEGNRSLFPRRD